MTISNALPSEQRFEDPLAYFSYSTIAAYRTEQVIYDQDQPSNSFYLVIEGKVKVSRLANDGQQTVIDIYTADEFFGESAFLNLRARPEQAVAMQDTKVMTWTNSAVEEIILRRPRLAIALVQTLVQRTMDFRQRIESFGVDNVARRLARSLIRFSERFGSQEEDGSVRMVPFTHELLSQYVGTSREIITQYMNQFRWQGYVRYSRKGTTLHREALREWQRQQAAARQQPAAISSSGS
jgi:CRP/FNR family cyclic AMP-dependent transcriptional regulator